jgi:hypothetical protein
MSGAESLPCFQLWRHSSHQNFWLHSLNSSTTTRLLSPSSSPHTSTAFFAPVGHGLHHVHANDLYVLPAPDADPIRVTATGGPTSFNGVPDWVYEEEGEHFNVAFVLCLAAMLTFPLGRVRSVQRRERCVVEPGRAAACVSGER